MADIFKQLAEHLNKLPGGFPETESGVELRILKRLFTAEEAELAVKLNMLPEPVSSISERTGIDQETLAPKLEEMSRKGLIFRSEKDGIKQYMAAQFVIGIWEYQVNRLTEGLIKDFNEYLPHLIGTQMNVKTKQLRVVPVAQSISAEMKVMPYEEAEKIVERQKKIVVADCICRKEHAMVGKGCDKPLGVCMVFGTGAVYYEENGMGRPVTTEEAIELLHEGQKAGLVLQPGNSQKPINICMCCGCCCQILKGLKTMEQPARYANSAYQAQVNEDACVACGVCEEKCPMEAITVEDFSQVNLERCIGCGVCVASCDYDAIGLVPKEPDERWVPPKNTVQTYMNIAQERGLF